MEDRNPQKISRKGFTDPVVITCVVERSLRDAIRDYCFEQDVTFHAFTRRALQLMFRKVKGIR